MQKQRYLTECVPSQGAHTQIPADLKFLTKDRLQSIGSAANQQRPEHVRCHLLAMKHKSDVVLQACLQAIYHPSLNAGKSVNADVVVLSTQPV